MWSLPVTLSNFLEVSSSTELLQMSPIPDEDVHNIVQKVVLRTIGDMSKLPVPAKQLEPVKSASPKPEPFKPETPSGRKKVAIGADHGGFELKEALKTELTSLGFDILDCGTNSKDAVDYPDFAHAVAKKVSSGEAWRGVMIDGAGVGSCMVANKVPGVRAAMAYDYASASNSREHNDANVLTLGAGLIGINQAKLILKTWLATEFGGGRHQGRIDKIIAVEKQYLKDMK
jgi:ribose 5-phosphate isomerase B